MNKLLGTALFATTLSLATHAAFAEDLVRESRTVDAKVTRVRLGGVVSLTVHQGAVPSLVISGDKAGVARVTTSQHGDTLEIGTESRGMNVGWHSEKMQADLTVPNLEQFVSQGVGSSTITGFSGDRMTVSLDGAGPLTMNGRYRNLDARLGGVGSFTLDNKDVAERIDLRISGAGRMTVTGQAKLLHGRMSGVGSLAAAKLRADSVELEMSGMGSANVFARTSANLSVSGLGSATVHGNPVNHKATTSGLGKVSWK